MEDIHEALAEIKAGAREGRAWRERAEARLGETAAAMTAFGHALEGLTRETRLHLDYGEKHFARLDRRMDALEGRGGGAVDVTVTSGNQTVGPDAAQTPARGGKVKAAAGLGGTGLFGWLAGGGWEQVSAFFKGLAK